MKRKIKMMIVGAVVLGVVLLVSVWVIYKTASGVGESQIEAFVRRSLIGMAGDYLNPELVFDSLDYQSPDQVVITNVRLRDAVFGDVLSVDRLTFAVAKSKKSGGNKGAIEIRHMILERPILRLIVDSRDGVSDGEGGGRLVGLSDLMKSNPDSQAKAEGEKDSPNDAGNTNKTSNASDAGDAVKPSEVFRIRRIELHDAMIAYDDGKTHEEGPLLIDGINAKFEVEPEDGAWYGWWIRSERLPEFSLDAVGRFNIDHLWLESDAVRLSLMLGEDRSTLPHAVAALVSEYALHGNLDVTMSGRMVLAEPQASTLRAELALRDGDMTVNPYTFAIETLDAVMTMSGGVTQLEKLEIAALDGKVQATATADWSSESPSLRVNLAGDALNLDKLYRADLPEEETKPIEGVLDLQGMYFAPMDGLVTQTSGEGTLKLSGGRFTSIPVLSSVTSVMRKDKKVDLSSGDRPKGDRATMTFAFEGDRLKIPTVEIVGAWYAMRGEGDIGLDGNLNLYVNGGPMEKLQEKLGKIGDILGAMTDRLVQYHVTGSLEEPAVRVRMGNAQKRDEKKAVAQADAQASAEVASASTMEVTTQPATTQPVTTQPAATQPTATPMATSQPATEAASADVMADNPKPVEQVSDDDDAYEHSGRSLPLPAGYAPMIPVTATELAELEESEE